MFLIVERIIESLALIKKSDRISKNSTGLKNEWLKVPQWQKSEEITNNVFGCKKYFDNNSPYILSLSADVPPTNIGITVNLPFLLSITFAT